MRHDVRQVKENSWISYDLKASDLKISESIISVWSVIKRPTDSATGTTSEQADTKSGQTSTTSGETSTKSGPTSSTSTKSGQASAMSDQTSFASTTSDKKGSAVIIILN